MRLMRYAQVTIGAFTFPLFNYLLRIDKLTTLVLLLFLRLNAYAHILLNTNYSSVIPIISDCLISTDNLAYCLS